jgi:mannose-6-phosphate isomerase
VHPPAQKAAQLGGEPKTEMWHIAEAQPGAHLYVGLRRGVTRQQFEAKISTGQVAECFHRIAVESGDTMFLPSGRVHAIGAGLVIFEIQQNSDTTYRVFDWNRVGTDGVPRELHVEESLASIDFDDFEPSLTDRTWVDRGGLASRPLIRHELFQADEYRADAAVPIELATHRLQVVAVVSGAADVRDAGASLRLVAGAFAVIPASLNAVAVRADSKSRMVIVQAG